MWRSVLLVAIGGAAGSAMRYLLSEAVNRIWQQSLPMATLIINIAGCLAIGFLTGLTTKNLLTDTMRLLLVTGFCGGFTTFSTFGQENVALLSQNQMLISALYISLSVGLGIIAVWYGQHLAA